jgi:hypothetical protein
LYSLNFSAPTTTNSRCKPGGRGPPGADQRGIHCTQFWREHYRRDDPHYWYADNLEDPNIRGYDAIRRVFLLEMAKAFAAGCAKSR